MITIDRIPFKYTSADATEQEFQFDSKLVGPTSITIGWEVTDGEYRISLGQAGDDTDSPSYVSDSNGKGWATLRSGGSIFAKPAASGAVIIFTR